MIDGVELIPLKKICDERGKIMHMLRADAPHFTKFGEIYFATAYPGVVKGWHLHKNMTQNYAAVVGMIKLVLYDDRPGSKTKGELMELFIGEDNYYLVKIPPMVWNGWKAIGTKEAILANCPDMPHTPDEMMRKDPFSKDIPYDWNVKQR